MLCTFIVFVLLAALATGHVDPEIQAMHEKLPMDQFIEYFNSLGLSYTITDYGKTFKTGAKFDKDFGFVETEMTEIKHDIVEDLPITFDAREKWLQCNSIRDIYDQGDCGSCWTFGTATTASDRTCIHKNVTVRLSEQDFECFNSDVCNGGSPSDAFKYWIQHGLVTQECKPYNITELKKCKCVQKCVNGKSYENDKHKGSSLIKVIPDDNTIKVELYKNGPIQAGFQVFQDFTTYKEGVYEHKFGTSLGWHSVRVLGYGVENDVPYWLVANSWSVAWGMNGLFKIKRFQEDIEFENDMVSGLP